MKRILLLCVVLLLLVPPLASGTERNDYVSIRSGIYTFTDGLRGAAFATGFEGEVAYGHYFHRHLILEITTDYFHDGIRTYGNDIRGVPILLTGKAVYPFQRVELYIGGGLGVYLAKFDCRVNGIVAHEKKGRSLRGANRCWHSICPLFQVLLRA